MCEKDYKEKICQIANAQNQSYLIQLAKEWTETHKDGLFLGCYKNKLNMDIIALYSYGVVYLLSREYATIMYAPKLLFHLVGSETVYIDDILTKDLSIGNGTILMQALFEYARIKQICHLGGFLSERDMDHYDRLLNYYHKFNFEIINNKLYRKLGEYDE